MNLFDLLSGHPTSVLAGFGLGLSLIVAIGAQNAYILRQGARREHLLAVLLVCILSDVALIVAGVAGFGTLLEHAPWSVTVMRWFGVLFLVGYAAVAARRAWRPAGTALTIENADDGTRASAASSGPTTLTRPKTGTRLMPVVLTVLALTWLNPHVYLDTVVLLGSVANTHGADGRWAFAIGACLGSVVWFTALGYGVRLLSRWLATPLAWRILDGIIAVIMLVLAISLALGS